MKSNNNYRNFNQSLGKFDLKSDFTIAIIHNDGFSERLLNYEIFIDINFNFRCLISSFKGSVLNEAEGFSMEISSKLPEKLKSQILLLLNNDFENIEEQYRFENLSISDIESKLILVNIDGKTLNINIEGNLQNFDLISKNEKRLDKLLSEIEKWIENLYEKIT